MRGKFLWKICVGYFTCVITENFVLLKTKKFYGTFKFKQNYQLLKTMEVLLTACAEKLSVVKNVENLYTLKFKLNVV